MGDKERIKALESLLARAGEIIIESTESGDCVYPFNIISEIEAILPSDDLEVKK